MVYLHCAGCGEDHPAGYFSVRQQALPPTSRLCIGREGFLRLCEHRTVKWDEVERLFSEYHRTPGMSRIWDIMCRHPSHSARHCCSTHDNFPCLYLSPRPTLGFTIHWTSHFPKIERGGELLLSAMARHHRGEADGDEPDTILCPVSKSGLGIEQRLISPRYRGCVCSSYGNALQPAAAKCRESSTPGVITTERYVRNHRCEGLGNPACVAHDLLIYSLFDTPTGTSREKVNPGKGWFSVIHPDSYNDGEKRWCNDLSCKSYLLAGEPHMGIVPGCLWQLRRACPSSPCA